jgi:hypothetical protein
MGAAQPRLYEGNGRDRDMRSMARDLRPTFAAEAASEEKRCEAGP